MAALALLAVAPMAACSLGATIGRHSVAYNATVEAATDAVLVANGHHWDARWPEPAYPGTFEGEQIHAHDYRSRDQLAGRDVVVVGAGNSAMDISVESSYVARTTTW